MGNKTSDQAILNANTALYNVIKDYLPEDQTIDVVFDLPDMDKLPSDPTLSVFLYEIHEDLQLRTGQVRGVKIANDNKTATINSSWVNVNCNYLITYWDTTETVGQGSPGSSSSSQAITIMNYVVNALINNRQLVTDDLPYSYVRMIAPKDELNSLGNFWQSLGNKPRLSLQASVTVPLMLNNQQDNILTVQSTEVDAQQAPFS